MGMVMFTATILLSCGGGGGGGGSGVATPPVASPCTGIKVFDGCLSQQEFEGRQASIARERLASSEFQAQWGLETINAHRAHAALEAKYGGQVKPGAGVTIGFIDDGIDRNHPEFSGVAITETIIRPPGGDGSHGTWVASVIAAQANGQGFVGVAPGAAIEMGTISFGTADPLYSPISLMSLAAADAGFERDLKSIFARDIDILNLSLSYQGIIENYNEEDLRRNFSRTIAAQAQADAEEKRIIVWSASNHNDTLCRLSTPNCDNGVRPTHDGSFVACTLGTPNCYGVRPTHDGNLVTCTLGTPNCDNGYIVASSPSVSAGLAVRISELRSHSIAVVALDQDGTIAGFSNRCGIAADICIAAPGVGVMAAAAGSTEYNMVQGTSFSAPMVAGGLALMKHFFRDQLSNTELVTRLYATADKTGIYSDRSIYGQGLMDLGAAVSPVGSTTITTGTQVEDAGHFTQVTHLTPGSAFGDGLSRALADHEIVAFDSLGSPFWFDLLDLTQNSVRIPSLTKRLDDLMTHNEERQAWATHEIQPVTGVYGDPFDRSIYKISLYERPVAAEGSALNLAEQVVAFTSEAPSGFETMVFTTAGLTRNNTPKTGAIAAWRPSHMPFGIRVGWLGEREALLDSMANGAFGRLSGDSFVTGLEMNTEFKGWQLAADAEVGLVTSDTRGGVIAGLSDMVTSAFSLHAHRHLTTRDKLTFSVSQPLRIERGSAELVLPVGRTKDGKVLHESVSARLTPSSRQIDLSMRWQRMEILNGRLRTEITASHNPGHMDKGSEFSLLAGWEVAF